MTDHTVINNITLQCDFFRTQTLKWRQKSWTRRLIRITNAVDQICAVKYSTLDVKINYVWRTSAGVSTSKYSGVCKIFLVSSLFKSLLLVFCLIVKILCKFHTGILSGLYNHRICKQVCMCIEMCKQVIHIHSGIHTGLHETSARYAGYGTTTHVQKGIKNAKSTL